MALDETTAPASAVRRSGASPGSGRGPVARLGPDAEREPGAALPRCRVRAIGERRVRPGLHRAGRRGAFGPVPAELLPVLRRQARTPPRALRRGDPLDGGRGRQEVEEESGARERLHRFVVAYYLRCLPAANGRSSKNHPTPVMAEFCHQLLTAHQTEASRAFVPLVDLLEEVLRDAVAAGVVRPGRDERTWPELVLSTIMFNAAYAGTISGSPDPARPRAGRRADVGVRLRRHRRRRRLRLNRVRSSHRRRALGLNRLRQVPFGRQPICLRFGATAAKNSRVRSADALI